MVNKKLQGKKNRKSGLEFERKVRKDLEEKGWIVSKWMNNVELTNTIMSAECYSCIIQKPIIVGRFNQRLDEKPVAEVLYGRLVPSKRKYNPFNHALSIGTGFPDFIAFKKIKPIDLIAANEETVIYNEIIGIEAKKAKYLDKEERVKCAWLLQNHVFSKILIAFKGKEGIEYDEFKE